MIKVSKQQQRLLDHAIRKWQHDQIISEQQAQQMQATYQQAGFNWDLIAKYSFWFAIVCLGLALFSALSDQWLMDTLLRLFYATDLVKAIVFAGLALASFLVTKYQQHQQSADGHSLQASGYRMQASGYRMQASGMAGVLFTVISLGYFNDILQLGHDQYHYLCSIAAVVFAVFGLWLGNHLVWGSSLLAVGAASLFLADDLYRHTGYFWGMNIPLRLAALGLLIYALSWLFKASAAHSATEQHLKVQQLQQTSQFIGLGYVFFGLWVLTFIGNQELWLGVQAPQNERLIWSLIFAAAALFAVYWGVKEDDWIARGYGVAFILINLYSRYVEYLWDELHSAIFFGLLAMSFWLLGRKAESLWRFVGRVR